MTNPEIPDWTFLEIVFGLILIFLDILIFAFFAALISVFFERGAE